MIQQDKFIIAPSILSADFAKLGEEVASVSQAGADWIHFDVMDNHYVPNLTFGAMVCKAIKPYCSGKFMDVHLMVSPVDELIHQFAKAGADLIVFHPDASIHVDRSLNIIKDYGLKAGVALNPAVPLCVLDHIMDKIDVILIMSINPGFGGQAFMPSMLSKISATRQKIVESKREIVLQVDGGVNLNNIKTIASHGANAFVMGSAIFNGAGDYQQTISLMRKQLSEVK